MEEMRLCSPEHHQVFRRVWARVMGEHTPCPQQQEDWPDGQGSQSLERLEGDLACDHLARLVPPAQADSQEAEAQDPSSPAGTLRRQVWEALERWQLYRQMARRAQGTGLEQLAVGQLRQARRLSAAYFLLTGVRYWPAATLPAAPQLPLWESLRRQYRRERQASHTFSQAAQASRDAELAQLYRQLSGQCQQHCRKLRTLLETGSRL